MKAIFGDFFRDATGHDCYKFQERFATSKELPHLVRAPTGAGKTATAVLGWLWRLASSVEDTPRRLVYCLPMRVLVEQSERAVKEWLAKLKLDIPVQVHVLMGGRDTDEWYHHPEAPAILMGTQDMLLSRALNRGYVASRFHWPIDFGLLNNDCLWVFDEPQLMANGVSTSAQLAGLRKSLNTFGPCQSVWMSATLEPGWLDTIDFRGKFSDGPLELTAADYREERLNKRMTAAKTVTRFDATSSKDMKEVARAIIGTADRPGVHQAGTQTLVVLNTVDRAKALFEELTKLRKKASALQLLLVHSRYRSAERAQLNHQLQQVVGDRIIVATQVVEAGVDISSRTLITELAPWASIVQRIGRCNRAGDDGAKNDPARVFWIELDDKQAAPYEAHALEFSRTQLKKLDGAGVSPKELDDFKKQEDITLPFEHRHVLRRRDLLDLFDTTPDLSGNDIDIQRFVRSDDPDIDVQVFWRDLPDGWPAPDAPAPDRHELCNVPVGQARGFLEMIADKKRGAGFIWDHLDERWAKLDPRRLRPGMVIMLPVTAGGYDWESDTCTGKGWDAGSTETIHDLNQSTMPEESVGGDTNSALGGKPLTITVHTANVCRELSELLRSIKMLSDGWPCRLAQAATWHDAGKAHGAFQHGMRKANPALSGDKLWAKSGNNSRLRHGRKHFRHELASALAALQEKLPFEVAYLIASHHGRARLAIRALPGEDEPNDERVAQVRTVWDREPLFAFGNWDRDELGPVDLGDAMCPKITLDLSPMRLGGETSWTARALKLLAELGPFKLAYLEAILRAADGRASRKEATNA